MKVDQHFLLTLEDNMAEKTKKTFAECYTDRLVNLLPFKPPTLTELREAAIAAKAKAANNG